MKENENRIYLRFREFECSPEEISKILDIQPSEVGEKDKSYFIGPTHNEIEKKWQWNYWEYCFSKVSNQFINEILTEFFDAIIIPKKKLIK